MSLRTVAAFCQPGVLTPQVIARWLVEGIALMECDTIEDVGQIPRDELLGAVMDAELEVDHILQLSEELKRLGIAFVFIAPGNGEWPGFQLRGGSPRIRQIEEALIFQNDDGRRH